MSTDELCVVRQQIPSIRIRTSSSKTCDFRLALQRLMLVVYSVLDSLPTFKPSLLILVVIRQLHKCAPTVRTLAKVNECNVLLHFLKKRGSFRRLCLYPYPALRLLIFAMRL
jgi:hypothetical protein